MFEGSLERQDKEIPPLEVKSSVFRFFKISQNIISEEGQCDSVTVCISVSDVSVSSQACSNPSAPTNNS